MKSMQYTEYRVSYGAQEAAQIGYFVGNAMQKSWQVETVWQRPQWDSEMSMLLGCLGMESVSKEGAKLLCLCLRGSTMWVTALSRGLGRDRSQ